MSDVAEFERVQGWRADGATSMTAWLAGRYSLSWGTAREWVRVARALRSLPAIARAFAQGDLSWDQVRSLTKFVTAESDAEWAGRARSMSPAALEREAARHQKITEREVQDLHRLRRFSMWWDEERPLLYFEGTLASEQGAAVKEALERRAEQIVLADDPFGPAQEARLADALVEARYASRGKEISPRPPWWS
ncbi:MAG: 13E12 repeat family protein, partial [Actinomycetota bacterium]|nr:13E12 repeat family protein [Actinomycetota bacterium]